MTTLQSTLIKEKPALLFNNPHKQKVYVFLKSNPGKTFEMFQVLTNDMTVSRQLFNEVEQAIKAREERDQVREAPKELSALFLNGTGKSGSAVYNLSNQTATKDFHLNKFEKKKMNERAKQYIKSHSDCTYEELVDNLGFKELSKPHFFSMKTLLRKQGQIPEQSRTRRGRKPGVSYGSISKPTPAKSLSTTKTIEILESIDATAFSDELREHYKSKILPLLKRLVPNGDGLHMVMLSDPPTIELRRGVR